jgi:curli biogenesis system outer membrane secretion channel CsgG
MIKNKVMILGGGGSSMFSLSKIIITALVMLSVGLTGCGGATTRLFSKPISESPYVTYQEWGPNRDVAVMPLVNVAKDKDAGLKVRELLITELYTSGAFKDVVDEGEMLEVMKKLKVRETDNFGKDTIKTLGDNLGVQAIIFGTVSEYTERTSKGALFAVSLRMVDVETGSILWLGNASKEGGGSISEALGLSDGPTVIDVSRDVLSDLVDDLASEIRSRKVKSKKAEGDAAVKKNMPQNAKSVEKDGAVQQAGPVSSPTVKSTSAGMTSFPPAGGN